MRKKHIKIEDWACEECLKKRTTMKKEKIKAANKKQQKETAEALKYYRKMKAAEHAKNQ